MVTAPSKRKSCTTWKTPGILQHVRVGKEFLEVPVAISGGHTPRRGHRVLACLRAGRVEASDPDPSCRGPLSLRSRRLSRICAGQVARPSLVRRSGSMHISARWAIPPHGLGYSWNSSALRGDGCPVFPTTGCSRCNWWSRRLCQPEGVNISDGW